MVSEKNQYADGYEGQIRPPASLLLGANVGDDLAGNYSLSVFTEYKGH